LSSLCFLWKQAHENISNTKKFDAVIVGGKLMPKVSLEKMDAERAARGG
jgi:hypothetical protein